MNPDLHHPLQSTRYRVWTPEMTRLLSQLQKWILIDFVGAAVWGLTRTGKTEAIRKIVDRLRTRQGKPIPALFHPGESHTSKTDNKFYASLLHAFRHPMADSGTSIQKYHRCLGVLMDRAASNQDRKVLIVMDEAQKLARDHYEWLTDLHNNLNASDMKLCVLLIGSPELKNIVASFGGPNSAHIRGRFMSNIYQFHGIRNQEDLASILSKYDSDLQYPKGSEVSYTEHFLPKAYSEGFRLEALASDMWRTFIGRQDAHGYTEWPMQFFVGAVQILLADILPNLDSVSELDQSMLLSAQVGGGLVEMPNGNTG